MKRGRDSPLKTANEVGSMIGAVNMRGTRWSLGLSPRRRRLEGQLLHEQVDVVVYLEAVQVVGVSLQAHQQASKGHVRRPAIEKRNGT